MANKTKNSVEMGSDSISSESKKNNWLWEKNWELLETLSSDSRKSIEHQINELFRWKDMEEADRVDDRYSSWRAMARKDANLQRIMLNYEEIKESLINSLWSDFHDAWRSVRKKMEDGTYEPRWKPAKDEEWSKAHGWAQELDIANTKFEDLSQYYKQENYEAAKCAINLVYDKIIACLTPKEQWERWRDVFTLETVEGLSSVVHDERMKRNPWDKESRPELFVPYNELPEEEKAKDRSQIFQAIKKVVDIIYG